MRFRMMIPGAAVALVLSGCTSPQEVEPDVALPTEFESVPATAVEAERTMAEWWAAFDPQLALYVTQALENNRSLAAARANIDAVWALRRIVRAQMFPKVAATGDLQRQETLIDPDGITDRQAYGIQAQWEIDIFGRDRNQARAAGEMAMSLEERYRGARLQVAGETARAYLTCLNLQARMDVLEEAIRVQRENLRVVTGRREEGENTSFDVARAQAQLAASEARLPQLRQALQEARHGLAVLVGENPSGFRLPEGATWSHVRVPHPPALLPATVLERRPDVQAAERQLRSELALVGAARAAFFPKFTLGFTGEHEALQFDAAQPIPDVSGPIYQLGLGVQLPLFTGGQLMAQLEGAKARTRATAAQYEGTLLQAVADVENAYSGFAAAVERAQKTALAADSASRAAESARGMFEGGLIDMLDMLSAEAQSQQQQDARLEAQLAEAQAAIDLHNALGGAYDMRHVYGNSEAEARAGEQ